MKKNILSILLPILILLAGCAFLQPSKKKQALTGNIRVDLVELLPEGKTKVDIMDGRKRNKRHAELALKFQAGIQKNYEWFVDYVKAIPEGQGMSYHPNIGLTEDEYKELQAYINDIELVSSGKANIMIKRQNNIIEFEADGKLKILEAIKIDLAKNVVLIGGYELAFSDTATITDGKNGLKSKWKGYTWKFEEPKDLDMNALKDLKTLTVKNYKFTIGRLEKNGKTYMSVSGKEVENGAGKAYFEIPLIF